MAEATVEDRRQEAVVVLAAPFWSSHDMAFLVGLIGETGPRIADREAAGSLLCGWTASPGSSRVVRDQAAAGWRGR